MKLYFIGIGGIGMSALVRYFLSKGDSVAGYDLTPSPLTHALSEEGATIHYEDDPELIPEPFRTKDTLVVFTPAVPHDHRELAFFRAQKNIVSFTTEQIGELMEELSFDDNKLIIAQEAYPNVVDPQNYYQLQAKFTFSSGKKKLSEFLQSVRR